MKTGTKIAFGVGGFLLLTRSNLLGSVLRPAGSVPSSPSAAATDANLNALFSSLSQTLSKAAKAAAAGGSSKSGGGGGNPAGGAGSGRSPGGSQSPGSVEDSFNTLSNLNAPGTLQAQSDAIAAAQNETTAPPDLALGLPDSTDVSTSPVLNDLGSAIAAESSGVPQFGGDPAAVDAAGGGGGDFYPLIDYSRSEERRVGKECRL